MKIEIISDDLAGPPPVADIVMPNSRSADVRVSVTHVVKDGIRSGRVMFLNCCQGVAPSMEAAS